MTNVSLEVRNENTIDNESGSDVACFLNVKDQRDVNKNSRTGNVQINVYKLTTQQNNM